MSSRNVNNEEHVSSPVLLSELSDKQQQALLNIIYRMRATLDVDEILRITVHDIRQMLLADRVGIFQFHPDSNYYTGEFIAESVAEGYLSAIATPVRDQCFGDQYAPGYHHGKVQAVEDIYNAGLSQCHIDVLAQFGVKANLIVPLHIKDKLWGLFCIHQCRTSRQWQPQEIAFIQHLGLHLDIAIQQGELFKNTLLQSKKLRFLTQERNRFFSLSPNLFCVANFEGKFIRVNPAWRDILGYVPEELTDGNFWSFVHPEDEGITRDAIQQLILSEETLQLEHRFRCADGSYKYLSWSGSAMPNEQLIYAIARDVTKRKRLEISLAERSKTLESTIRQLHQTQTQLVQSAKMSSLGQLVAGVAHEINNPINFISGNIGHVKEYTESLLEILNAYRTRYPKPDRKIVELMEELEFDFLLEDLPAVLRSMQLGTTRIKDIVLSLRNFSRLDEATLKEVDIHEGLDSTLLILQSRINANLERAEISVLRQYGDLPKVECYPGQLNQVFMNILSNAIDAIAISKKAFRGVIRITTTFEPEEGMAVIYIRDNGYGMNEKVSSRIFDPFFTTKEVGQGTGLGLSISYQIIHEHHQGLLSCKSELGVGTEFTIKIPVRRSK